MKKIKWKKELPYILFVLPAFIAYTLVTVYPLVQTLWLSFTNWDGYSMQNLDFVGLENYLNLFNDRGMKDALKNTCLYAVVFPLIVTLFAIPLSLVLNSKMRTRNLQRAVFFFPSVPSAIILGYLWMYLLSPTNTGIINKFLGWFHIKPVLWLADPQWAMFSVPSAIILGYLWMYLLSPTNTGIINKFLGWFHIKPVLWLADPQWAMFSIILVGVWSAVGWHACIYLAQLQSIPGEYYEAATIDGAGAWQKFRYITFPMLSSAMTVSVMLLLVNALKIYDLPFALTKGGPGTSTTMISQIIIKVGFVEKNYGKATAMSAVFFVFIMTASIIQLKLMKKREVES